MNTDFWNTAYNAVKDVLLPIVPSLMGSVVSLNFLGKGLSIYHKISSVVVGVACAVYVAPAVITWFGVDGKDMHASLQFLIGLFALAVGREIFREIENGLIAKIRDKFLGGDQ
jgi:hypothetical protein